MSKKYFIFGELCSGKSTYAKWKFPDFPIIEIGEIVRHLVNKKERVHIKELDVQIAREVDIQLQQLGKQDVVIVGVRQISLLKELMQDIDSLIYLQVQRSELKRRFLNRKNKKEKLTFEDAIEKDDNLGMRALKLFLLNETDCLFIKNK